MSEQDLLTDQDAFDISAAHLLRQNKRSGTRSKLRRYPLGLEGKDRYSFCCRYRGPRGLMCALGPFIPDDVYEEHGETLSLYDFPSCISSMSGVSVQLLEDLQEVHDRNPPRKWRRLLKRVAERHGLSDHVLERGS